MKQIRNYDIRVTLVRKIQNIELCAPYQYKYQLATKKSSSELEIYSELAIKNCFSCLGHPQSGHAMLCPFFQPRYSTVLNKKFNSLLSSCICLRNRNLLDLLCYSTVQEKREFFCAQLHCIEFNIPRTNFSIKQPRGKNRLLRTGSDQLYPRAFSLRPNRVLFFLAIFKRAVDEKMLALPLRTSAT